MIISAEIKGLRYVAKLGRSLESFNLASLGNALASKAAFLVEMDNSRTIAVSWWVSSKRTRSYPYARVYDTLQFSGKRATIIPVFKDEGKDGDRDFLQWDTVSLMSLLGIYVIIAYYRSASPSTEYRNKITNQRFDTEYLRTQLGELIHYQSDALHWNLSQVDGIGILARKALLAYKTISRMLKVEMHSEKSALRKISYLLKGKKEFTSVSRKLAERAQLREIITIQPKEKLSGTKAGITIKNYLGGFYYFTVDEARRENGKILLIEGKHTKRDQLPSTEDIKDGLLKMILYTNLQNVSLNSMKLSPVPVLLLTTGKKLTQQELTSNSILRDLREEARLNGFRIQLNDTLVKS